MLTQSELKKVLDYDKESGAFTWINCKKSQLNGCVAGTYDAYGYVVITVNGVRYKAHRLAYLYAHGRMPNYIDHINRVRDDNSIVNLRESSLQDNPKNCSLYKNNTSGIKGVYFNEKLNRWVAQININKKRTHLGCFRSAEEAKQSREKAEKKYYQQKQEQSNG
jgi:hypothetical protein